MSVSSPYCAMAWSGDWEPAASPNLDRVSQKLYGLWIIDSELVP
jgi:hypothetical protein